MLVIRGVNVFPSQIESVVMSTKEIEPFYEIIVYNEGYMDKIEVRVEFNDIEILDDYKKLELLVRKVGEEYLKDEIITERTMGTVLQNMKRFYDEVRG